MSKLKPLLTEEEQAQLPPGHDNPYVVCDLCGKAGQSHLMYNMMMAMPVAGDHRLYNIGCKEHWACSLEHWREIAIACIDEHILPLRERTLKNLEGSEV